jgi:hypothetical protein
MDDLAHIISCLISSKFYLVLTIWTIDKNMQESEEPSSHYTDYSLSLWNLLPHTEHNSLLLPLFFVSGLSV